MITHSSILAWKIPWTEEPGWLQSMELQNWRTRPSAPQGGCAQGPHLAPAGPLPAACGGVAAHPPGLRPVSVGTPLAQGSVR